MSHYINPYTDFGFKKLFGEEASKELLLDFLNQVLPETHRIRDLSFKPPANLPDLPKHRGSVFDIFCHSVTGERFIVEMQQASQEYFKDRSLFYSTFPIREQAVKGKWDLRLAPVYCVGVLDFEFAEEKDAELVSPENSARRRARGRGEERDDVLTVAKLKDQHGETFYEKLTFAFIEMPRFQLEEHELKTRFQKWLYFLKNLTNLESIPAILREPIFEKGFAIANLANMDEAEQLAYERSLMHYRDAFNVVDTAYNEGKQAEREATRERMRRKGFTEGQIRDALEEMGDA